MESGVDQCACWRLSHRWCMEIERGHQQSAKPSLAIRGLASRIACLSASPVFTQRGKRNRSRDLAAIPRLSPNRSISPGTRLVPIYPTFRSHPENTMLEPWIRPSVPTQASMRAEYRFLRVRIYGIGWVPAGPRIHSSSGSGTTERPRMGGVSYRIHNRVVADSGSAQGRLKRTVEPATVSPRYRGRRRLPAGPRRRLRDRRPR